MVHVVCSHGLESALKLIGVQVSTGWESNEIGCTMVSVVNENLGIFITLENFATSGCFISCEDGEEFFCSYISSFVVDDRCVINIWAVSSVEELTWEGV